MRKADIVIRILAGLTLLAIVLSVAFYAQILGCEEVEDYTIGSIFESLWNPCLAVSSHRIRDVADLILRAALGMMIFAHGYNKAFRGGRLAGTGRWYESLGMRPARVYAALAAHYEMGVGVLAHQARNRQHTTTIQPPQSEESR